MNLMLMRPLLTALSRMVLAVALLASGLRMVAQPIENAVFTLGTTTTDAQNRTWGYVVLSPTDPAGGRYQRAYQVEEKRAEIIRVAD